MLLSVLYNLKLYCLQVPSVKIVTLSELSGFRSFAPNLDIVTIGGSNFYSKHSAAEWPFVALHALEGCHFHCLRL